jgi:cytochrome c biogenesis protein ResB
VIERFPGYDAIARPDATAVSLVEATTRPRYVTGLQVGRNPGAGIVFVGGFIMVIGLIYTFMFPHTRVWLRLAPEADGTHTRVSVTGWVDRSQVQFEDRFNAFVAGLTTGLQAVSLSPPDNPSSGSPASADLESGNPAAAPGAPSTGVTP